jgi:Uma2 family endonuclease
MALAPEKVPYLFTVAEYLTFERATDERHESLDGVIYAMAGEGPNHGRICTNLTVTLGTQLRGSPCEVCSKDTKVRSGPDQAHTRTGLWSYPDFVIVCGQGHYHDQYQDVLLNPRMLVEVLSPSTTQFDRGVKWDRYRTWLPSLQDYVLVAQDTPRVEHWHRLLDGAWRFDTLQGLDVTLHLPSIVCQVPLLDVYDRIVFPRADEALEASEGVGRPGPLTP